MIMILVIEKVTVHINHQMSSYLHEIANVLVIIATGICKNISVVLSPELYIITNH